MKNDLKVRIAGLVFVAALVLTGACHASSDHLRPPAASSTTRVISLEEDLKAAKDGGRELAVKRIISNKDLFLSINGDAFPVGMKPGEMGTMKILMRLRINRPNSVFSWIKEKIKAATSEYAVFTLGPDGKVLNKSRVSVNEVKNQFRTRPGPLGPFARFPSLAGQLDNISIRFDARDEKSMEQYQETYRDPEGKAWKLQLVSSSYDNMFHEVNDTHRLVMTDTKGQTRVIFDERGTMPLNDFREIRKLDNGDILLILGEEIKLIDNKTGDEKLTLPLGRFSLESLAFASDGRVWAGYITGEMVIYGTKGSGKSDFSPEAAAELFGPTRIDKVISGSKDNRDGGELLTSRKVIENRFRDIMDRSRALKGGQDLSLSREDMEAMLWILNDLSGTIKDENTIVDIVGKLSDAQKSDLNKLARGMVFANHGIDEKIHAIFGKVMLNTVYKSDAAVYQALSKGFGKFVASLAGLNSGPGGLLIGANAVFENAGTLSALKQIQYAQPGLKIVFWAKSKKEADKLRTIGAEYVSDIVIAQSLTQALKILRGSQVENDRIVLVNSDLDNRNIKEEFKVQEIGEFLAKPEVKGMRIVGVHESSVFVSGSGVNAMPLVLARATSAVYQKEKQVVDQYEQLSGNSGLSRDTLKALNDLEQGFTVMPLVQVSAEIAKAQKTYEETISKL